MFIQEYNGHKYRIFTTNYDKTVIAVSSFAGKRVRGVAKCSPEDTFDLETGVKLAILRCDLAIAMKKVKRAAVKIKNAEAELVNAKKEWEIVHKYAMDADEKYIDAEKALHEFMKNI
jgi:hypothetical protein